MLPLLPLAVAGCAAPPARDGEARRTVVFAAADGGVRLALREMTAPSPGGSDSRHRLEEFLYGPQEERSPLLRNPQGMVVSGGYLYVCDPGLPDVVQVELASGRMRRWAAARDRPPCPVAAAVDSSGRVYVADTVRGGILVYDVRGRLEQTLSLPEPGASAARPCALLIHDDVLYVADAVGRRVERRQLSTGAWQAPIAGDARAGGLAQPSGLAMTPDGVLLISDALAGVVHRVTSDGSSLTPLGRRGRGAGELIRPMHVACAESGLVFVADSARQSVSVFDADGAFVLEIAERGEAWRGFTMPIGVACTRRAHTERSGNAATPEGVSPEYVVISDTLGGRPLTVLELDRGSRVAREDQP
ncbi:MAG: hypothetical protein HY763_10830 [Planctomycetes bacterium]|nr:hypothetical protein [Planctomycetota bacterium]